MSANTSQNSANLLKRCNIPEDIVKRLTSKHTTRDGGKRECTTKSATVNNPTTCKKAALEKLLLDVKMDTDVANVPLYSEAYQPSVCLPSSGYKSDSRRYRKKASLSADERSPDHSPVRSAKTNSDTRPDIRRTRSLGQFSVTDRIRELKKKLHKKTDSSDCEVKTANKNAPDKRTLLAQIDDKLSIINGLSDKNKDSISKISSSVQRARSFNAGERTSVVRRSLRAKPKNSSVSEMREHFSTKPKCEGGIHDDEGKSNENDIVQRRRERRRSRRAYASRSERSDSETDSEESQLTKAALERLELRSNPFHQTTDENNNEITSNTSDKTLDSGIFDIALNNLSQDIRNLSKRYDSDELLLDDMSLNSGYSSATESIAGSVSTVYDSPDDSNTDVDGRRRRFPRYKYKNENSTCRTAVFNAAAKFSKPINYDINKKTMLTTELDERAATKVEQTNASNKKPTVSVNNVKTMARSKVNKSSPVANSVIEENGDRVDRVGTTTASNHIANNTTQLNTKQTSSNETTEAFKGNSIDTKNSRIDAEHSMYSRNNNTITCNSVSSFNERIAHKKSEVQIKQARKVTSSSLRTNSESDVYKDDYQRHNGIRRSNMDNNDGPPSFKKISINQGAAYCEKNIKEGDSLEFKVGINQPLTLSVHTNKTTTAEPNNADNTTRKESKPTAKSTIQQGIQKFTNLSAKAEIFSRGTQCLLLNDNLDPNDGFKEILCVRNSILEEVGGDIVDGVKFRYPDYLITKPSHYDGNREFSSLDAQQLKMENVRLQQLLFEVEKARTSSVKALLHVNNMYNRVQVENTRMEGDIMVSSQDNEQLSAALKQAQEDSVRLSSEENYIANSDSGNPTLSLMIEKLKQENKELHSQMNKHKAKSEEAESDSNRLRVQYKRIKEQLEHSNNAFTQTLQNNLEATKRMEIQLQTNVEENQQLLAKCDEGNKMAKALESLKNEIEELKASQEELEDEKDELEKKCAHLEKQKRQFLYEQEELHEQIGHSQEIIEKLTDVEEELEDRLQREIKDKEYLQECLDETGQILYQLKNHQEILISDKDTLLDDLEAEVEEKETLLNVQSQEQRDLMEKLQDMTNIHITVKESLQQANKKEKNYQEQIEQLTKINHILHYSLEKEKEERYDLEEMFQVIESSNKKFKMETVGNIRDLETKLEESLVGNEKLTRMKDELARKCDQLQTSVDEKESESARLRQQLDQVEKLKCVAETELNSLRQNGTKMEQNISETNQRCYELQADLKSETERKDTLLCSLEETEVALEKVTKELHDSKAKLIVTKEDVDDLTTKIKERHKRMRELEVNVEDLSEQRDKFYNRLNFYESETKELRKTVSKQTEEIGNLKIEVQRVTREKDTHKRNYDMSVRDFETHKMKCGENLKKLKDEIVELSKKIVEKDRLTMKQKVQFQDQIDNTQHDLQFLRQLLDGSELRKQAMEKLKTTEERAHEKIDLNFLRTTHDRFRDEFQSHVEKLEGILKDSKQAADSITVVQSPMSKIKLEELKQLRNEVFDLNSDICGVKEKLANCSADITVLKLGHRGSRQSAAKHSEMVCEYEAELSSLMELMTKIEFRHKAVMSRNAILLQRTLNEDDDTARDLVKKFQVVSLEGENKQLKTLLGILKKKYNFNDEELAAQLQQMNQTNDACRSDGETSVNIRHTKRNNNDTTTVHRSKYNNSLTSHSSDEDYSPPSRLPNRNPSLQRRIRK